MDVHNRSVMDDSVITCDEVIESYDKQTKTISKYFNGKKAICKMHNFYILLAFLLFTKTFLIAFTILVFTLIC